MSNLYFLIFLSGLVYTSGQTLDPTTSTIATTTQSNLEKCTSAAANKSCSDCLSASASCLWCGSYCMLYPPGQVLPSSNQCPLDVARWGTCWMNYQAFLIALGVIVAIVGLIMVVVCLYCCCCRGRLRERTRRKLEEDEARVDHEREERRVKSDERKQERKAKYDEIRRKYGLIKDDQPPYERFDDGREGASA